MGEVLVRLAVPMWALEELALRLSVLQAHPMSELEQAVLRSEPPAHRSCRTPRRQAVPTRSLCRSSSSTVLRFDQVNPLSIEFICATRGPCRD